MKIAIIINADRLTSALDETLKRDELQKKFHITYDLFLTEANNLESVLNDIKSQSYNGYIIGGGDGTVRTAAQVFAGSEKPIAILPLGTFNVLAQKLDYPNDIEALLSIVKNGKLKQIDLIDVNGNVIINHAWIGFYYYILKLRNKHQQTIGRNKLLKILFTTFSLFKLLPIYNLYFKSKLHEMNFRTCLVFIGNNQYQTSLLDIGNHKNLSSGLLSLTILNCHSKWQLFLCMLSLIFRGTSGSPYITQMNTDELKIDSKSQMINIVLDGELFKLSTPLIFKNLHKHLTVFIP